MLSFTHSCPSQESKRVETIQRSKYENGSRKIANQGISRFAARHEAEDVLLEEVLGGLLDDGLLGVVAVLVPLGDLAVAVEGDEGVLVLDEGLAEGVLGGRRVQDQRVAVRRRHDLLVSEARIK